MRLEINGKLITTPIRTILETIRHETGRPLFRDMIDKGKNLVITCAFHKNGAERHPSCQVFQDQDGAEAEYGFVHCFTCGYKAPLYKFVADCFEQDEQFGKDWLVERFGNIFIQRDFFLPEIAFDEPKRTVRILPESILSQYNFYHPYMYQRNLTKTVIDKFKIGYDKSRDAITFPVWDDKDQLVMITARSVRDKTFYIDKHVEKPVYLLNFIKKEKPSLVYVAESQINTLVLWSWGYPAIGLFGTGSSYQYDILKKSGIRNYVLCLDGDEAGDKGIQRFIKNMPQDVFISIKVLPRGKDVADLSKEQFDSLQLV